MARHNYYHHKSKKRDYNIFAFMQEEQHEIEPILGCFAQIVRAKIFQCKANFAEIIIGLG
ncbi:MAG: hypothetical protein AAF621_01690 [Pseudomonadota bacterium]